MVTEARAAAIYCRISKDIAGQGLGVERQRELCEQLAKDKGWPVAEIYLDNDLSAFSGKSRPAYERMLADLEAGTRDAVVVLDQDRLCRRMAELVPFIDLANRLGIPLANVQGDIDLSTTDGRFKAHIMGAVAEQESSRKSDRLKRQKDQSASKGWAQGGRRRYGYQYARTEDDEATLEIVPEEAEIVREIADRFLGSESLRQIAKDLNERQIPTVTGKTWRVTTLRTMLTGPHITGLRVHRGEIVGEGNWDPILDRATWEQARAILGDPRRKRKGRPPSHLLTSILECSRCGGTLHHSIRADNGKGRYVCNASAGSGSCGRLAISAEATEQIVSDAVLQALDSPEMEEALAESENTDTETVQIVNQIEQAESSLDRLAVLHFVEGKMSEREYLAARDGLEEKISELRVELVPDTRPVAMSGDFGSLRELWAEADTDTRREIIATVTDRIIVGPGKRGMRKVDPGRLDIRWSV